VIVLQNYRYYTHLQEEWRFCATSAQIIFCDEKKGESQDRQLVAGKSSCDGLLNQRPLREMPIG
jgi:hypothetical protein